MARSPASKSRRGWIAFAIGLAICVAVGGVIGVVLGKGHRRADTNEMQRIAALALDTGRLNDNALGLSRAIEAAIKRHDLRSQAAALRDRLARLEAQAENIQIRAESKRGADLAREARYARERARRGLAEIERTLAVFRRKVAARLRSVLSSAPAGEAGNGEGSGAATDEALADVMHLLEEQSQSMDSLGNNLTDLQQAGPTPADAGLGEQPTNLVSGSFQSAPDQPGFTLRIGYQLQSIGAEASPAAEPGRAGISASASGLLTVRNTTPGRDVTLVLPVFDAVLYWNERDVPAAVIAGGLRENQSEELEADAAEEEGSLDLGTPCRYEMDGEVYCALARLAFGEASSSPAAMAESTLEPNQSLAIDGLEADSSLLVDEAEADAVTEFIGANRPDFVQIVGVGSSGGLVPACVVDSAGAESSADEVDELTVALLRGDGTVVFQVEGSSESASGETSDATQAPECYTIVAAEG